MSRPLTMLTLCRLFLDALLWLGVFVICGTVLWLTGQLLQSGMKW